MTPPNRDTWDPGQYHRFTNERSRPFYDLAALLQTIPNPRMVDLGCGTGELTADLHKRLGASATIGMDSSASMLERAAMHAAPGLTFLRADIESFSPPWPADIVFSNAALQWVDDHEALFARARGMLGPGGQLAVQMPANHDHPSHTVAAALAIESPWREVLGGHVRRSPVRSPEWYALLLHQLGFEEQNVRMQVYTHLLSSREDVVEWVKGTMLTDYQKRMTADQFTAFLDAYRRRLLPVLEDMRPYCYPFKRLLLWARLPGEGK